jgi:hypothetical protein
VIHVKKGEMRRSQWVILSAAVFLSATMLTTAIVLRIKSESANSLPTYTITFCDADGRELVRRTVQENAFAVPPETPSHGSSEVFLGWGNPLYPVTADATCKPQFEDMSSGENVFFTDTVYIEKGTTARVPIRIGGSVALDQLELELHYNPDTLSFRSAESSLGEIEKAEDGIVRFTLAENRQLQEPTTLTNIEFEAIAGAFTLGEFSFEVPVAKLGESDVTFERIKTQIYVYKK